MKHELYRAIIKSAHDAEDGETPTILSVTEENNGYGVWLDGYTGSGIIDIFRFAGRDRAIERAVALSSKTEDELYQMILRSK